MSVSINQHFTPIKLLRFALPSIVMMIFMSLYTIVDGALVSRFVGSNALSSLNIVYPIVGIVVAIATMLGTGGNAIISKYLGEGRKQEANECLTQFVVVGILFSVVIMILTLMFLTPISYFLGSNELLLKDCNRYLAISILFAPACMLQSMFQSYFVTASKPSLGLFLTVIAGIMNAILDYVFIVPLRLGVSGAALATGIGQSVPVIAGIFYFFFSKNELHFAKFPLRLKELGLACYNGSSEMISQLSGSIVTFLFNIILMRLAGAPGVAAITILLYGQFLFNAFHLGFSMGISPIIGFQYGAQNKKELKNIYKISFIFVVVTSLLMCVAAILSAKTVVKVFTNAPQTYQLALTGFQIFAVNFLFSGFNIATSGFFTALSNGKISAMISFSRTLVITVVALLIFPEFLGVTGAWIAIPVSELLTFVLCIVTHYKYFIAKTSVNYFLV